MNEQMDGQWLVFNVVMVVCTAVACSGCLGEDDCFDGPEILGSQSDFILADFSDNDFSVSSPVPCGHFFDRSKLILEHQGSVTLSADELKVFETTLRSALPEDLNFTVSVLENERCEREPDAAMRFTVEFGGTELVLGESPWLHLNTVLQHTGLLLETEDISGPVSIIVQPDSSGGFCLD